MKVNVITTVIDSICYTVHISMVRENNIYVVSPSQQRQRFCADQRHQTVHQPSDVLHLMPTSTDTQTPERLTTTTIMTIELHPSDAQNNQFQLARSNVKGQICALLFN